MLLESASPVPALEEGASGALAPSHWGVASETGRLLDVLVGCPAHLAMVPCNAITRESLAGGLSCSTSLAAAQHRDLVTALERAGVRCHLVPPIPGLADLCFTRDAILIGPWGRIELRPGAAHRRAEPAYVSRAASLLGVPYFGQVTEGTIEGGDVCLLREGLVLIGRSGDRTDEAGAHALGALFENMGWEVIHTRFDPAFLHLDTLFTMVSPDCAVACLAGLDEALPARLGRLGIEIIPASMEEVRSLGANLLSLGDERVVAPAGNDRLNALLEARGIEVIAVELDQFTRCGGGAHCLTMPLARR